MDAWVWAFITALFVSACGTTNNRAVSPEVDIKQELPATIHWRF